MQQVTKTTRRADDDGEEEKRNDKWEVSERLLLLLWFGWRIKKEENVEKVEKGEVIAGQRPARWSVIQQQQHVITRWSLAQLLHWFS